MELRKPKNRGRWRCYWLAGLLVLCCWCSFGIYESFRPAHDIQFIVPDDFSGEFAVVVIEPRFAWYGIPRLTRIEVPHDRIYVLEGVDPFGAWHHTECVRASGDIIPQNFASLPFPDPERDYFVGGSSFAIDELPVHTFFVGREKGFYQPSRLDVKAGVRRRLRHQ